MSFFRSTLVAAVVLSLVRPVLADVEVLFRSGQADTAGFPLAGFDRPRGAGGAVVVRGRTSALFTHGPSGVSELLRTGSPLPAPLAGTFNRFRRPVVNASGAVVFHATLNSSDGAEGLFLLVGTIVTPVIVTLDQGTIGAFDLNDLGTVAYVRDDTIYLWNPTSPASMRLIGLDDGAPGGGAFRHLGRITLNGSDVVAFAATRRGGTDALFTAGRSVAPGFVSDRSFGDGAIALNDAGQVAFTSDGRGSADKLLRFDPGSGVVQLVLKDAPVDGAKIVSFDPECVALDAAGRIVFEAQLDGKGSPRKLLVAEGGTVRAAADVLARTAAEFASRISADGQLVYTLDGRLVRFDVASGVSATDVAATTSTPLGLGVASETPARAGTLSVFAASREALEAIAGGVAQPLVQVGDSVTIADRTSTITTIGPHVVVGAAVAFTAKLGGTDSALLLVHDGLIEPVVTIGQQSPVGGAFLGLSDVLESSGTSAIFIGAVSGKRASGGIFRAELSTGRLSAVVTAARKGKLRLQNFAAPTIVGSGAAFRADRGKKTSLFLTSGRQARPVLVNGTKAPGLNGKINALRAFAGTDAGVCAAVALQDGDRDSAIYRVLGHSRPTPFILDGGPAPGGGAYRSVGSAVLAGAGPTLAFLVPLFNASGARGVFTATGDTVTLRLIDGAALPDGGRLSLVDTDVLGFNGDAVVLTGRLTGASTSSRALVAVR